ncbi:MAG: hypothetical protein L0211_24990 [Planctomycetaceae bacterium]|nr:hypothetical protein [Planctomycetaceae bacterium]
MRTWMKVGVETSIDWPTQDTNIEFEGRTLTLRPPTDVAAPDIQLQYEHPEEEVAALGVISRFLSAMCWHYRRSASMGIRVSCTAAKMRVGRGRPDPAAWDYFEVPPEVQTPANPKACLALALYREAISLSSAPYEFLGYFKIINIVHLRQADQVAWINATLPAIAERNAKARIAELAASEPDVGQYLYVSGRCAVAHAHTDPVVDPDNPEDFFRLSRDMPVARALAEHLIHNHFGIPRR